MSQEFFVVLPVAELIQRLEQFSPLPAEEWTLSPDDSGPAASDTLDSLAGLEGRVLARAVTARDDVPLMDRSGMDGYSLRAADTFGASENNPAYLSLVGRIAVDCPANFSLEGGQCAGIVTGGALPQGADAVLMVEYSAAVGKDPSGAELIEVRRPVPPGAHVLRRGDDARQGQPALAAKTLLRPQEIGLLAAVGATSVCVHARPRVGILSTGDEVIPITGTPRPGQVRDVNSHALAAMCREAGALPRLLGIVPDSLDEISAALARHLDAVDVLLLSGGSSVGARDFTIAALARLPGAEILCHGVALSPGKPLILARVGQKSVWGLPGQVASAQVVMFMLGRPFLRLLAGEAQAFDQSRWPRRRAVLARNMASKQGREDYVRVRLAPHAEAEQQKAAQQGAELQAVPVTGMSGLLRTLLDADGLVRIAADREGLEGGMPVDVLLF